jgi:hypothetical protein
MLYLKPYILHLYLRNPVKYKPIKISARDAIPSNTPTAFIRNIAIPAAINIKPSISSTDISNDTILLVIMIVLKTYKLVLTLLQNFCLFGG